ncbi:hypothetical protein B566_EDAN012225 [Ephemera danica]|nr:hypothetical protein B566_EDAN012225 [Ephemera danica]
MRFLERNPSGGMHHICLRVSCIKAAAEKAKEAGLRLLEDRPPFGPHGQPVIFLHPSDCGGVLFELEEAPELAS